jgi:hypothetical protein
MGPRFQPAQGSRKRDEMKDPGMGEFDGRRILVIGSPTI